MRGQMKKYVVSLAIIGTIIAIFLAAPLVMQQEENICGREGMRLAYIQVAIAAFRERNGIFPKQNVDWNELMRILPATKDHDRKISKPIANVDSWGFEYVYFDLGEGVFTVTSRGIQANCEFKLVKATRRATD
jgi:type II secretory pathway pseudopilin PulG